MARADSADVVVIGAGAVGASVAYELALRGARVVIADVGAAPGNGCSYANAGLLSPSHVEPLATPCNVWAGLRALTQPAGPFRLHPSATLAPWLARFVRSAGPRRARLLTAVMRDLAARSAARHLAYAARGIDTGLRQSGSLDVYLSERAFARAQSRARRMRHTTSRYLPAGQARRIEPSLGDIAGGVWHGGDAFCSSLDFTTATLAAAQELGARIAWGAEVTCLGVQGGRVSSIRVRDDTVAVGFAVVAAGLGARAICATAGVQLPLEAGKGYVIDVVASGPAPSLPVTLKDARVVMTPYEDRLRLCGTMELGGAANAIDPTRVHAIRAAALQALPGLRIRRTIEVWAGRRPCLPDGVPAIGRSARARGLYVAAGHGMWGLVLAPATGALIAEAIVADRAVELPREFAPDRFSRRGPTPAEV